MRREPLRRIFCRRCSGVESEQQWVSLLTELQGEALANTPPHTLRPAHEGGRRAGCESAASSSGRRSQKAWASVFFRKPPTARSCRGYLGKFKRENAKAE